MTPQGYESSSFDLNKMSIGAIVMKENNDNNEHNEMEVRKISSDSPNHLIRKYFIDKAIETIEYMSKKAYQGRIRNEEHEKIKINQLKLIINGCNVGNRILKDYQLDILQKEMEVLKEGLILKESSDLTVVEISPKAIEEIEDLDDKIAEIKNGE